MKIYIYVLRYCKKKETMDTNDLIILFEKYYSKNY